MVVNNRQLTKTHLVYLLTYNIVSLQRNTLESIFSINRFSSDRGHFYE